MDAPELPLTGRRAELHLLDQLFREASAGRGGAVLIVGEAGVGKSRLMLDARQLAQHHTLRVFAGHAFEDGGAYRPLVAALSRAAITAADDPRLAPVRSTLARILPAWTAKTQGAAPLADPTIVLGEAILELLAVVAPEGCALFLDDLHWADRDTVAVLDHLVDDSPGRPLALVLSARQPPTLNSGLADQAGKLAVDVLELRRLDVRDAGALIRSSGPPELTEATVRQLVGIADGLPLVIDELIRHMRGCSDPAIMLGTVPAGLASSVHVRLSRLTGTTRLVLDALAVADQADGAALAFATQLDERVVSSALREALDSTLIIPTGTPSGVGWRHRLIRDSVAQSLLPLERQALARGIAEHLTKGGAEPDEAKLRLAATLYRQANSPAEAASALSHAASAAVAHGALQVAEDYLAEAAQQVQPHSRQEAELVNERLEVMLLAGRGAEAYEQGRAAAALAPNSNRTQLLVAAARGAVAADQHALAAELLSGLGDVEHPAIGVLKAHVALARNRVDEAADLAEQSAHAALDANLTDLACEAWEVVGRAQRRWDPAAAEHAFSTALRLAQASDLLVWQTRALAELGTIDLAQSSDPSRFQQARDLAEELGLAGLLAVLDLQIGACTASRDGFVPAFPAFAAAYERASRLRMDGIRAAATAFIAECVLRAGGTRLAAPTELTGRDVDSLVAEALALGQTTVAVPWAGCTHGSRAWLAGDEVEAVRLLEKALAPLRRQPGQHPSPWWGLWALLSTATDTTASDALNELQTAGLLSHHCNRGALRYGQAILALRRSDLAAATELVATGSQELLTVPYHGHLLRTVMAPAAAKLGYDAAEGWLREAEAHYAAVGERALQRRARASLKAIGAKSPRSPAGTVPPRLAAVGITTREVEVLNLLAHGQTNAQIATHLVVSVRTVETHVSSLFAKAGVTSRGELRAWQELQQR